MRARGWLTAFAVVMVALAIQIHGSAWAAQNRATNILLEVVADEAHVLVAPVIGAPEAGTLQRGEQIESEIAVNGEQVDGSHTWYLVTLSKEPELLRGFIHSSEVAEAR